MKNSLEYIYKGTDKTYLIKEDIVGFYLIIYENRNLEKSIEDHLFDSLDDAFQAVEEKFGILRSEWKIFSTEN